MILFHDPVFRSLALHLWQATWFGLVAAFLIVAVPGLSAKARHVLGGLALARFFVPTSWLATLAATVASRLPGGNWLAARLGEVTMPAFIVSGAGATGGQEGLVVTWLVAALWAVGCAAVAWVGVARLVRGLRAVKRSQILFGDGEQARLDALAERAGLRPGAVRGYAVKDGAWLGVVGLFRSRVLVPEGLFSAMDEAEVDAVLLHELMHVRRRDNLVRLLQAGAVALLWFHPLVWWLDRRLRWESERACDDGVLRVTGANAVYASGLLKATRFALGLKLPGVSGMSRFRLRTRIEAVLNHQPQKDSLMKFSLLLVSMFGLVGFATLMAAEKESSDQPAYQLAPTMVDGGLSVDQLDQVPVLRHAQRPLYPKELKEQGKTATVVIELVIDREGIVREAAVKTSTNHAFDAAALEAVRQWTFSPGKKAGKPVNTRIAVPIVFSLKTAPEHAPVHETPGS
ncbi:regulatory protein BlaR1 [mine drainage metagenome]|uniref:Regulatory protein BlaR1 n=1 Tax=mine drainage metagenome TaxID=410659 RepID=A0A1J5RSY2_9ZZZZ